MVIFAIIVWALCDSWPFPTEHHICRNHITVSLHSYNPPPSPIFSCFLLPQRALGSSPETSRCTVLAPLHRVTFSPAVHPPLTALTFTYSTALDISPRNGLQTAHRLCIHAGRRKDKRTEGKNLMEKRKWQSDCKIGTEVEGEGALVLMNSWIPPTIVFAKGGLSLSQEWFVRVLGSN